MENFDIREWKKQHLLLEGIESEKCPMCHGEGQIRNPNKKTPRKEYVVCPRCQGEGKIYPRDSSDEPVKPKTMPKVSAKSPTKINLNKRQLYAVAQAVKNGPVEADTPFGGKSQTHHILQRLAKDEFAAIKKLEKEYNEKLRAAREKAAQKIASYYQYAK